MSSKQGFFESDSDYRDRISREADERTIENISGEEPRQHFLEHDRAYERRIEKEADEHTVEDSTGDAPRQKFLESDSDYQERVSQEADERTVEDNTGDAPRQRFFEGDDDYRDRVEQESNESVIEKATGDAPRQGFFESDDSYSDRISQEADEARADDDDGNKSGCFLTTACVDYAGLSDDCHELTVLREFRDNYVAHQPGGIEMLRDYYDTAPKIVAAINRAPERRAILGKMFATVRRAVADIEAKDCGAAFLQYTAMFARLKRDYAASR
jgi:hypothetical protein